MKVEHDYITFIQFLSELNHVVCTSNTKFPHMSLPLPPHTKPPASLPVEDEKELLAPAQLVLPWGANDFVCRCVEDMGVSKNSDTPKSYQIIHFNRVFHYKPSIWGVFPYFGKHPYV